MSISQTKPRDVAIYLDLDNLVISARQAKVVFDIDLLLTALSETIDNNRIVLRNSYGDWRQNNKFLRPLSAAGFNIQTTVALNGHGKNLADMQIVVDAMDTLADHRTYDVYVIISGDRDFSPLIQTLRKRGKYVIGVGIRQTVSPSLISLCDEYIYYEDIVAQTQLTHDEVKSLLEKALDELLEKEPRVQASILKQRMLELSKGTLNNSEFAQSNFRQFLLRHATIVMLQQEGTTTYARRATEKLTEQPLHQTYRSTLKKQRLRVIPYPKRIHLIRALITLLQKEDTYLWRHLVNEVAKVYLNQHQDPVSKNMINAVLLLARKAEVIVTLKDKSLGKAPVRLQLTGPNIFKEAVKCCDAAYLRQIHSLSEPFDINEAAIALYGQASFSSYLATLEESLSQA